ncbi:hypothetical protein Tco_0783465 [Tanacetum coccineum]
MEYLHQPQYATALLLSRIFFHIIFISVDQLILHHSPHDLRNMVGLAPAESDHSRKVSDIENKNGVNLQSWEVVVIEKKQKVQGSENSRNTQSLDHAKSMDINIYGEARSELLVGFILSKDIKQYYKINEAGARGDENGKSSDSLSKDIKQYYKKKIDNKQNARMMSMGSATVPYPAVLPGPHMPNPPAAAAPAAHLDQHFPVSFLRDMISIVTHLLSAYTDTRPDVCAQNGPNIHSIATSALTSDYQQHTARCISHKLDTNSSHHDEEGTRWDRSGISISTKKFLWSEDEKNDEIDYKRLQVYKRIGFMCFFNPESRLLIDSHDRKTEHLGSNGVGTRVNTVNPCPLEFHQRTPIEAESAMRVNFPLSPVDLSVKG